MLWDYSLRRFTASQAAHARSTHIGSVQQATYILEQLVAFEGLL